MVDETKKTKRATATTAKNTTAKAPAKTAKVTSSATNTKASKSVKSETKPASVSKAKTVSTKASPSTAKKTSQSTAAKKPQVKESITMPNKPEEKTVPTIAKEAAPIAAAAPAPVVVKSGGGLGLVSLLLSLGALGLSGYMYMQGMQNKSEGNMAAAVGITEVKKDVERIDSSLTGIQTNVDSLKDGVTKLQTTSLDTSSYVTLSAVEKAVNEAVTSKVAPLIEDQSSLEKSIQQINKFVAEEDNSFEIKKASQLLESAQYQIEHQGDVDGGIKLLTLAGNAMQGLKMPELDGARSKVLSYVDNLQAIDTPDLVSVSNTLAKISKDVSSWPLKNEPKAEVIEKPEVEPTQTSSGFLGELKSVAKEAFNESFKLEKVSTNQKVLLAPKERYFLDQNMKLKLQSAQTAMIQGQQAIYSQMINDSKSWASEYFDEKDARVLGAVKDLAAIVDIQLQPELPDISDAVSTFNRVASTYTEKTVEEAVTPAAPKGGE